LFSNSPSRAALQTPFLEWKKKVGGVNHSKGEGTPVPRAEQVHHLSCGEEHSTGMYAYSPDSRSHVPIILKFPVGSRIEYSPQPSVDWIPGTVIKHWHTEPLWQRGQIVPYQVRPLNPQMQICAVYLA